MSGLKLISKAGQTVYRGLRFTGDYLVVYDKTPDYNGLGGHSADGRRFVFT